MKPTHLTDNESLSDRVSRYIIEYIRTNRLGAGDKIPSEIRVSADLQISRGIVREAYRSLRAAGILEIFNGCAPRVGQINSKAFTQLLQHALSTQQASVEQILDLRSSIEVRAAELAAINRSETDVAALERELDGFDNAKRHREEWVASDMRFHFIIGEASGNPFFGLLSNALRESLEASIRIGFASRTKQGELDDMVTTHKRLAQAIIAGDADKARHYMAIHFDEARTAILRHPGSCQPTSKRDNKS